MSLCNICNNHGPLLESRLQHPRNHHCRSFYYVSHRLDQIWPQCYHRRGAHAGLGREGSPRRWFLRRNSTSPSRIPCVYGRLLQVLDWLHRHGVRRGYRCDSNDVELVAKAVQALIGLQAPPGATLGHIGGGTRSIVHSFFPEWLPNVDYKSDQDFYAHIHKVSKVFAERLKVLR